MIPPTQQWAIQIEITNECVKKCSNCTRLCAHTASPFHMGRSVFLACCDALKDFPEQSEPDSLGRKDLGKRVGMMGGEPQTHPIFPELVDLMRRVIPEKEHRGIWTSMPIDPSHTGVDIRGAFGYINHNTHRPPSCHQPGLVAIKDVIDDKDLMWRLIDDCWMQQTWSSSVNPKGFFFCEIAAAMDMIFGGPGGFPIEPGMWRRPLADFRPQIERWCPLCGFALYNRQTKKMAVPGLKHRMDTDKIDDLSESTLAELIRVGSPRVERGDYELFQPTGVDYEERNPWHYWRGGR